MAKPTIAFCALAQNSFFPINSSLCQQQVSKLAHADYYDLSLRHGQLWAVIGMLAVDGRIFRNQRVIF